MGGMERHIKIYRTHRLLAILYMIAFVGIGAAIVIPMTSGKDNVGDIPWGVYVAIALVIAIICLHWTVGGAAKERQPWACVASMVIAVLLLPGFPLGTIIGIYLLVNAIPQWDPPNPPRKKAPGAV